MAVEFLITDTKEQRTAKLNELSELIEGLAMRVEDELQAEYEEEDEGDEE